MQKERTAKLIEQLRLYRERNDMPQNALAGLLEVSPANLSEIMRGHNAPSAETVLRIQEVLLGSGHLNPSKPQVNDGTLGEQPDWLPQPTDSQSSVSRFRATITKNPAVPANREQVRAVVKKRGLRAKQFTKPLKPSEPAVAPVAKPAAAPVLSQRALTTLRLVISELQRTDRREGQKLMAAYHMLQNSGEVALADVDPRTILKQINSQAKR